MCNTVYEHKKHAFVSYSTNKVMDFHPLIQNQEAVEVYLQGRPVRVTWFLPTTKEQVLASIHSVPFASWMREINQIKNPSTDRPEMMVNSIHIQSVDMFGPSVGFIKFKADVLKWNEKEGRLVNIPGITFMRGGAVAVLPILVDYDSNNNEEYVVLTVQARVPVGSSNFVEIPAGMLDDTYKNFKGKVADEMKEETGLDIKTHELVDLTAYIYGDRFPGIHPSAGGCDEFIKLYAYKRYMGHATIKTLSESLTGAHDGEIIKLKIVRMRDLISETSDVKAVCAYAFYQKYNSTHMYVPLDRDMNLERKIILGIKKKTHF